MRRIHGTIIVGLVVLALVPALAAAAGRPPDLVAPVNGDVRLRIQRGISAADQHMFMQVDRAANGVGWDESYDLGVLAGANPVINTGVAVRAGDLLNVRLEVGSGASRDTVSYATDRDPRPGTSRPHIVDHDVNGRRRECGGGREGPQDVTSLYDTSAYLISLSCWEDGTDFDYNDFAVAVDYTPETVPPTPTDTATPVPTPTMTATSTATATPTATTSPSATPTAVPTSLASCVCRVARQRVPAAVLNDALANPDRYYGWRYPLDPGKPLSPANPPRTCLTLHDVGLDFHPVWNRPEWRVGCP